MSELQVLNVQMMTHKLGCPTCKNDNLTCKIADWLKEYMESVKND